MRTLDDFEAWGMFMDDSIQQLMDYLPTEVTQRLDFSSQSLGALESWLLDEYPSNRHILQPSESWILDRVTRYVGETIRRTAGGKWNVELERPEYAYYRLPEIKRDDGWVLCPVTLVTAALDRRKGTFIETVVQNMIKGKPIGTNHHGSKPNC